VSCAQPSNADREHQSPSSERLDEVEDFVDFIASRALECSLARAAAATSAAVFAKIWTNPDDDAYDAL
jgi:hypothetical protein